MSVPSSEWAPPAPFPQASVPAPWNQRGGNTHSLAGEGVGGANSDDRKESLALCLYSVLYIEEDMKSCCHAVPRTRDDKTVLCATTDLHIFCIANTLPGAGGEERMMVGITNNQWFSFRKGPGRLSNVYRILCVAHIHMEKRREHVWLQSLKKISERRIL